MNLPRGAVCFLVRLHAVVLFLAAVALASGGCETRPPRVRRNADQSAAAAEQDHLALAMTALKDFHKSDSGDGKRQLLYQLNRWIDSQATADGWERDPLVERLPRHYRELPELSRLDERVFVIDDTQYLLEAYWLKAIGHWVSQDATERWIAAQRAAEKEGSQFEPDFESPAYRLEIARSLFDWTVRQIQLDPLLPFPRPNNAAAPGANAAAEALLPPEQALPGPGYIYYPYQVLIFGHGDAWQRARVFILIARQFGIGAVMLAVDDRGAGSRANAWCPAVLIDGKLYLFDSALGLPIPGETEGSIADLASVRANPELLKRLDVDDDGKPLAYPVTAEQLKSVAALIDAAPETLSRRMHVLEGRLSESDSLVLAVSPSELARQLRASPGLKDLDVRIWTVPFETRMYRDTLERMGKRNPEIQRRLLQERGLYLPAILQGRNLHFLGAMESKDDKRGAIEYYMDSRKADALIDEMLTSEEAAAQLGAPPLPESLTPQQKQLALAAEAAQYRFNKQHASYWIGLAQYDLARYEAAIDWLKERTLEMYPNGLWTGGAQYNLGRTYEALGRTEEARKLYYQAQSPQRHGNLLRARMLRGEGN